MTRTLQLIVEGLEEHGIECPADVEICRTRAGYWQRSAGAWSWFLRADGWHMSTMIGSQYPAKQIAKGFNIYRHLGQISLEPA